ncbi:helix-turn-helix transcriptional regulator [Nitrospirillum sp. BR 11163]|uniref:helix-turn-helix transcriptional regulator n=1 Tax=Nitrospirillum sp. BR 11163 TaxID=3104323 RepID=UPI002AFE0B64|nr:helix-turn-helix transcriptional regulator [Nitrospirillum sp. BR 11163]MEA1675636.1 helix-turn-helix transcriptional regulator [Nitrospirillum sp. BR 11163]
MSIAAATVTALPSQPTPLGLLLREWRAARRMSQMDLALEAGVSTRHLSCVETGKAQPSRELLARLADTLDMPLRERNALLVAAGYAPRYSEATLATPEMAPVRQAIDFIIKQQEPYPALVMNRRWDVVRINRATARVVSLARGGMPRHNNILRQVFDPDDMRPVMGDWERLAGDLICHLHNELAATPFDPGLRALLDDVLAFPGVPARWRSRDPDASPLPLCTTVFAGGALAADGHPLRFFSTITTFGSARDVMVEELRIECMFPADERTAERCRALAAESAP